ELGTLCYDCATAMFHLDARATEQFELPGRVAQDELLARIHPDDAARFDRVLARASAPGADGRYAIELRLRKHAGGVRWLSVFGRVQFAQDGARRATEHIGVVQDITERKLDRERSSWRSAAEGRRNTPKSGVWSRGRRPRRHEV